MKKSYQEFSIFKIDIGKINVFGQSDIMALEAHLDALEGCWPKVRGLIFKSDKISPRGLPIFCAGADQRERADWSYEKIVAHVEYQRSVLHRLRQSPLWIIACVNGLALGLGTELCLASDFVLASEQAQFGFPEKDWGIVPGAGGTAWAHGWAPHKDAAQAMIQTGERISSEKAQWLGIVDVCIEGEEFDFYVEKIVSWVCSIEPQIQIEKKRNHWKNISFENWFSFEHKAYCEALKTKIIEKKT
jgi:enoyl-CoA hydratase/carnithine racemase